LKKSLGNGFSFIGKTKKAQKRAQRFQGSKKGEERKKGQKGGEGKKFACLG
jgi:hypothetical protein